MDQHLHLIGQNLDWFSHSYLQVGVTVLQSQLRWLPQLNGLPWQWKLGRLAGSGWQLTAFSEPVWAQLGWGNAQPDAALRAMLSVVCRCSCSCCCCQLWLPVAVALANCHAKSQSETSENKLSACSRPGKWVRATESSRKSCCWESLSS